MKPSFDNYLEHYGVVGMKWGVRKDKYKSMSRQKKKETRMAYRRTPEGAARTIRRSIIGGTILGGPVVGVASGAVAYSKFGKYTTIDQINKKLIEKGKKKVNSFLNS